jgi:hypothetical protein
MVRSLEAMTSSQIKRDLREDNKKSMLSRLSPKQGSLFKLLLAKSWKDENPKLPAFTKKTLVDRDSQRALGEMKSISKRWTGNISEKGILSFLANGYAADDKKQTNWETYFRTPLKILPKMEGANSAFGKCT